MLSWKHAGKAVFVMALTQSARFSLRHFYRPCSAPSFVWKPLYEHFYFLTNDYHGETLLWLLCRPDVIGQLNATLLQELQLPCRNAFIENDARTDAGAPILFCYLPDLPRLFRFLSALELLQMKGAILCFDFQAGALRPLCGDKVELQIIDFAEFERRFLTSP